ncbi:hypothetical protein GTP41_14525 [Pseudoduganella sp. DS3]|uniref:Uncharacterized protein n=1 Tax=Pseudoduganella guangdongensis TaxID=2692179 RepID=A0A6N9HIX8_9BURK|nr:hypothetical protein [Pseudoduganella guangdongensis]MYN03309.1 hypothetical protein [Pseudoduganella guangdongensis]
MPPILAQTAAQAAPQAALADLPAAQVPNEVVEVCIMFKAMANVFELTGARQRVRVE